MPAGARIVRLANFVTATSGGQRTALHHLGRGYLAAGHHPVLVVPGARAGQQHTDHGLVITLPGTRVPGLGGYRVLPGRRQLAPLLHRLAPDRLEVCDRTTLRWTGPWAARHGVPSMLVAHESLTGLLGVAHLPQHAGHRLADRLNAASAQAYDRVVCTTAWAAAEFRRVSAGNLAQVPLGVDLDQFHPDRADPALRARLARPGQVLLVHSGRLSAEKRPDRAVAAVAGLRRAGVDAVLVVAGTGPLHRRLTRQAAGLPVRFVGFLDDRDALAALLATADAVIAPGPIETFGLAALEALACGTPVVVDAASALPEVVADAGVAVGGEAYPQGLLRLLERPEAGRRQAARRRAERFGWPAAVAGFLATHNLPTHDLPTHDLAAHNPHAHDLPAPAAGAGCSGAGPAVPATVGRR